MTIDDSNFVSQVEEMNGLVLELATVAAHERGMLNECEALLVSTAAMQVRPIYME